MPDVDVKQMLYALKLAQRGVGDVEPNPPVGCVIVKGNQVAGKGFHKKFGGPHAEITALEDCKSLGVDPKGATMYVTLEPCCHQGKTPPCTDAIIQARIGKVIVAAIDPSGHNNGQGIQKLRDAGIEVVTGICETQAKVLAGPFMKYARTSGIWITLKWAQSIDGKLAWADQTTDRKWISNEQSRKDVQMLRHRAQAILVGINTVLSDDPLLTPRPPKGKKPMRIVLDSHLRTPLDCQLIKTVDKFPLMIFAWDGAVNANPEAADKLRDKGAEILVYGDTGGRSNLHILVEQLGQRGIQQLLVEGGPSVLASFMREDLADEIIVYVTPKILGACGTDNIAQPLAELTRAMHLLHVEVKTFDSDIRLCGLTESAIKAIGLGQD
ncbi:MAG: bifunctional diaminohydroxyphosphoribosylaminopyrimidine deaminase/5-amino-6-(5-phosphoribosylamino)uracil reductase RibD [Candidatus Brocadiia bacterium]|nr:MAG: bifunctional diaminohydroxyphosphoribosylaminopyrimidine deaminase/5-amino-6-(5-phosphoribosylamino)uracil reductase RibD [Candidatus Brocadiia bacterium]